MAGKLYRVVVPYVTLKVVDPMSGSWTVRGYYRDAMVVADDVEPASLRNHVDGSMVVEVEDPAEEPPRSAPADPPAADTKAKAAAPAKAKA